MAEVDYKPGSEPYPEQDDRKLFCKFHYKGVLIIVIPLLFWPILFWDAILASRMLFLTICVYLYYIFNVMAQGAVAFLFIVFLPVLGISHSKLACMGQFPDVVFATLGSVFLGVMMNVSKLSERLGMALIGICGANLRLMMFVVMIFVMISSLLTNSTFAAAVWMKIVQAAVQELGNAGVLVIISEEETYERQAPPYPSTPVIGLYLAVAYAATLGAMCSPFQEPNDLIFTKLSGGVNVSLGFMLLLLLVPMILGAVVIYVWLNMIFLGWFWGKEKAEVNAAKEGSASIKQAMADKKTTMGPWSAHCILAAIFILITALLCTTRRPMFVKGWSDFITKTCDSSVGIVLVCIICFSVAANYMFCRYYYCQKPAKEGTAPSLVGWKVTSANTPWGHIFMMTAGMGFVMGVNDSHLLDEVCGGIIDNKYGNGICFVIGSLMGVLLTNLTPIEDTVGYTITTLLSTSGSMGMSAMYLAIPYAMNLHNQFLLPVSSTSSTIVAGWGNLRPYQFLLGGCVPTLFMLLLIYIFIFVLGPAAFKV